MGSVWWVLNQKTKQLGEKSQNAFGHLSFVCYLLFQVSFLYLFCYIFSSFGVIVRRFCFATFFLELGFNYLFKGSILQVLSWMIMAPTIGTMFFILFVILCTFDWIWIGFFFIICHVSVFVTSYIMCCLSLIWQFWR